MRGFTYYNTYRHSYRRQYDCIEFDSSSNASEPVVVEGEDTERESAAIVEARGLLEVEVPAADP